MQTLILEGSLLCCKSYSFYLVFNIYRSSTYLNEGDDQSPIPHALSSSAARFMIQQQELPPRCSLPTSDNGTPGIKWAENNLQKNSIALLELFREMSSIRCSVKMKSHLGFIGSKTKSSVSQ